MVFGLNIKGIANPIRCLEGYAFGKEQKNFLPSNVDKMKLVVLEELIHSNLCRLMELPCTTCYSKMIVVHFVSFSS